MRCNLGNSYAAVGETRRAMQFYEEQLAIVREIGYRRGEGNTLWNMSLTLDQLGERDKAIQHAEQALIIREKIEDPRVEKVRAKLDLLAPTQREENSISYCPRCQCQFVVSAVECPDCPGVGLVDF